jgi:U3 small nucleolar ribonucleoprotein protein IMP4
MIRRNTRLRKEYLYRKSLSGKEKDRFEKKKKIKEALAEGKPVPTELRTMALELQGEIDLDPAFQIQLRDPLDDEYAMSGIEPPKILLTTSRDPSSKLIQFAKEMSLVIPGTSRMNRGNHVIRELSGASRRHGFTDLIMVHETRGRPDGMIISHLPYGPTAYFSLFNVVMRHDVMGLDTMSIAWPHLIFHNFNSNLGKRVVMILKYLFPPAKEDTKRVLSFVNQDDWISFRTGIILGLIMDISRLK